ncbi:hypothetical protein CFE70_009580 [Pyrenophora teres f. teres 0-1]|uniref:Uncharacterized protein n=2 Tax=Pyrenophora teres f. teres TaxID=97479 RepID=E3RQJ4_PYRTT|nr:hypothetical protein PTT_10999 [Pyrenophora teres f. teres 0-1]KAE8823935.1 hypothetical protein HRS9139_09117 [Pyrenophora teres f. teres]KAE8825095.1 hypothetical protein HRS9122_10194 [Pyrenophora teres f. teres]KAE8827140.1 hypothetical protein PTNB85_08493 [Pyrenophora teres f. teres]KAE8854989.1 hypothetical protein PTNB29_09240 [Pyrenophora teres f. teres]
MPEFQDIPAELRNSIYSQLLERRDSRQQIHQNFGLFTVSKQMHNESTSYFYQHNPIDVHVSSPATHSATVLPPIADKHLRYLRWLSVYATTAETHSSRQQKVASTIASLAVIGAEFKHLHICLQSSLSKLLSSRVDDAVFDSDHPITVALRQLLKSDVADIVSLELCNTWFASGVAQKLHAQYGTRLRFVSTSKQTVDPCTLERPLTGTYVSTHLTGLDLDEEAVADARCPGILSAFSTSSTPSSLVGSLSSAFADLDAFSAIAFGLGEDEPVDDDYSDQTSQQEEETFFSMSDVEEWESSAQEQEQDGLDNNEDMDLDDNSDDNDEEMEEIPEEEMDAIMGNMEDTAHRLANDADMSYMTNFAPELLLTRHNLGHLA